MLGIFDSGLGGLTVARALLRHFPKAGFLYLGDTARLPYGTKSPDTVAHYALQALRFLHVRGADHAVLACHTVSSVFVSRHDLQQKITRMFPRGEVFDMVTPTIRALEALPPKGRVGVIATKTTLASGIYQHTLQRFRPIVLAAPLFVALAEEGWGNAPEARPIITRMLHPFRERRIKTIVLACTHFPILRKSIHAILGNDTRLIDPGEELGTMLEERNMRFALGKQNFFVTDIPEDFTQRASRFLGRRVHVKKINL